MLQHTNAKCQCIDEPTPCHKCEDLIERGVKLGADIANFAALDTIL